ncbi:Uncharacterised protein [Candidatus Tiddalikarchaeum anstoanum]|nr:Uncharacterised protein [Candidatus Tiddalikarchaeum anstoanum]
MTTVLYLYNLPWLTPLIFTALIALLTSILSQLAFAFFTDKTFMKTGQEEMKKLQQELLKMKVDEQGYSEKQNKLLDLNMSIMTHTMKPTMVTMIPFLLIFLYAKSVIPTEQPLISFPVSLPFIGPSLEFIGTYILFSLIFTTIIRKIIRR